MPSQLFTNPAVSFIVGKSFMFNGEEQVRGEDFDQDKVRVPSTNIETLVRNRFLIPVVDSYDNKPRHWYREVQLRSHVEAKMGSAPTTDVAEEGAPPSSAAVFNPGDHRVREVRAYVAEHPEELEDVIAKEERGRSRSTLLGWLFDQLPSGG